MSRLHLSTEWLDPMGAKGADLRATWAALKIEVHQTDDKPPLVITRIYDTKVDSRRFHLRLPLYPLAEWIAFHWFQMLHGGERTPPHNHHFWNAGGGYALPKLSIWAQGDDLRVRWDSYHDEVRELDFDSWGDVLLPRSEVEATLSGFLNKVVHRLEEHKISGTPFQEEWQSILKLDQDEREFCIAAASLGLDPFNLEDQVEERILEAASLLPNELKEEFFPAVSHTTLLEDAKSVMSIVKSLDTNSGESSMLDDLRQKIRLGKPTGNAWESGYCLAQEVRAVLKLKCGPVPLDSMLQFGMPMEVPELNTLERIDGVISRNCSKGGAAVRSSFLSRRPDNLKFAIARILCEQLLLSSSSSALVTREKTSRQKTNRAFAAEFLAPASEIQERVGGKEISREEISDLAEEFEVSSFVIENQIQNHGLALIIE